ncbi:ComF family protein [Schlesneria paludicola]|uniref:ComF family protein n=1 Tax=Schlesneria paludicola TaxID=360056 RepID=UPI00029ABD4A|nr:phosphoribosyltransferase family protein [Schlesneria paludicola]
MNLRLRILRDGPRLAARVVSKGYLAALDFVYPPSCLLCAGEMPEGEHFVCGECRLVLRPPLTNECDRCGAPVGAYANLEKGCGQCRHEVFSFDGVIRLGTYDGALRKACLRAKSSSGAGLTRGLARALFREKEQAFHRQSIDAVIPVPEHWTRRAFHAHYAAETFSRELARQLQSPWAHRVLIKRHRTAKQATSPTPVRRRQQQGTFGVRTGSDLKGKTILLVDDILTTGSTASAATRTLKQAGAKQVVVAVIAVSPLRK